MATKRTIPKNFLAKAKPRLSIDQSIQDRIASAALIQLKSILDQRVMFLSSRSGDSLHQMRVAIRRLRTVLHVLGMISTEEQHSQFDDELRNLARVLGQGRDQDVFLNMLQKIPSTFHHDLDMQERAVYNIISIRDRFYLQIDVALHSSETDNFLKKMVDIFQARKFELDSQWHSVADLDARLLDTIHKKVMKRGRRLSDQNLVQRHRFRLSLKRLRYAIEFMSLEHAASLKGRAFKKVVDRLLNLLGSANDAFTASRIARESLGHEDGQIHLMAGMIAGWHGGRVHDSERDLIKTWAKFKSMSVFWH